MNPTMSLMHNDFWHVGGHYMAPTPRDSLDPRYRVQGSHFFEVGTVFAVLWPEPAGNENSNVSAASQRTFFTDGLYGQRVFNNIRRMVVAKVRDNCSWCFPVSTYGGQGVAKRGIDPRSHAVMYMADTGPLVGSDEPRMTKKPLRIVPASPGEKLDPMSRLNFGKVHTVEHNIRVRPIGRVSRAHMPDFVSYAQQELLAS